MISLRFERISSYANNCGIQSRVSSTTIAKTNAANVLLNKEFVLSQPF